MGVAVKALQEHGWIALAAGLGPLALSYPVELYLIALAVFGLPHVLWEMAWVWRVWSATLPRVTWVLLASALLLQAAARIALWHGRVDADVAALCDAATLALALLAMLVLWPRVPLRRRWLLVALAVAVPMLLIGIADTPAVMGLLALLAIAHNFTPIGLVPADARLGSWQARRVLLALFALPLALFALLLAWGAGSTPSIASRPSELGWVQQVSPRVAAAVLPALVWAQCLHYLAVIYLVPRSIGTAWQGVPWRSLALLASALLFAYFVVDFTAARGLYAVAAGMHAWLEWPLILLVLVRPQGTGGSAPRDHSRRPDGVREVPISL